MFILNSGSGVPIYRQLVDQVKRMVAGGQLAPGDNLPSVRELAGTHAVNPMTVSKAYNQLEAEGVLVRRRGKPMQVANQVTEAETPRVMLEPYLASVVQSAEQLGLNKDELPDLMREYLDKEK
ncbi:GntR family transcriptional regulator [Gilvimarinus sp. SDUM040013]|uniref:GntR family transcriptional regulator n=1 Tax=Gilvimarinus gilvus TaxID=3058038 RepID=A0ABU4S0Y4_9GAMM|nr:GntR family transcriptional regulator [Gilvimarinus sp. SDUM040013]MDO3384696.1 GntR family transcriptional regulator [Gilvimarinus sp. SDUM040013]MDX6850829.1 GntR family transcriptional regulator [Gilvimarinus sp. SDUM040013]